MDKVYVIGRRRGNPSWEIMGIYTDQAEAEKMSDITEDYIDCVMEQELNVKYPEECITTGYHADHVIQKGLSLGWKGFFTNKEGSKIIAEEGK